MPDPHRPKAHAALRGAGRARSVVARCLLPAVLAVLAALAGCAGLPAWPTRAVLSPDTGLSGKIGTELGVGTMGKPTVARWILIWTASR